MKVLTNEKLQEVSGGAVSKAMLLGAAAVGIFIIGVFDGFFRPLKCNN